MNALRRIITMANMKGGVGKTTSTICTAMALHRLGEKVEVRDIDPQGSATLWAEHAREAGTPLPFEVKVANRFTVGQPPEDDMGDHRHSPVAIRPDWSCGRCLDTGRAGIYAGIHGPGPHEGDGAGD